MGRSKGIVPAALLAGALADQVLGDPPHGHPVAGFGQAAAALERRVWRPSRVAGAAYTLALVGGAAGAAALANRRLRQRPVARALLLAGLTWTALGGRSLARTGRQLGEAVRAGADYLVVGRPVIAADDPRAAAEAIVAEIAAAQRK